MSRFQLQVAQHQPHAFIRAELPPLGHRVSLEDAVDSIVSQRMGPAKLAKQHGNELPPSGEPAGVPFSLVLPHGGLELAPGKQLRDLAENACCSGHGLLAPSSGLSFAKNSIRTTKAAALFSSKANLDKGALRPDLMRFLGNWILYWVFSTVLAEHLLHSEERYVSRRRIAIQEHSQL